MGPGIRGQGQLAWSDVPQSRSAIPIGWALIPPPRANIPLDRAPIPQIGSCIPCSWPAVPPGRAPLRHEHFCNLGNLKSALSMEPERPRCAKRNGWRIMPARPAGMIATGQFDRVAEPFEPVRPVLRRSFLSHKRLIFLGPKALFKRDKQHKYFDSNYTSVCLTRIIHRTGHSRLVDVA